MALQGVVQLLLLVGSLADIFEDHDCSGGVCKADNSLALLQSDARSKQRSARSDSLQQHRATATLNQNVRLQAGFDCEKYPHMCQEPFNCHKVDVVPTLASAVTQGLAHNGVNLQSWCNMPEYQDFVYQCLVEKDLVKAGHTQFGKTKSGEFGESTYLADGSYCFIEGHCLNTAVTENTTLAEAAQMCDARYGHERWTSFGSLGDKDSWEFQNNFANGDMSNGFSGQEQTTGFLLGACAMGNYHCDVIYCRETYCKQEDLREKFGHFLHDYGWDKLDEPWFKG
eukprot:TRINITY_DN75789_c0_g1_i1.p1 TRINITY_DN75789_c0_g1~~TRINITY_DN75789_c0_g1_i1.p1  ORF type:complete len:305 (+),score=45.95 TRINITY_DN75789_c0_g1_i1:69-917(+)